ncbi:uncharacterized protein I206_103812 [Kwoniella pini CBS 10737]|uniref:Domain of unknown function at the cortex 1 domain-containing protein n=1 Tax=Kwoniella pini CBS 10737 TaxID=1296096 RepID=A0A1B9HSN8_9TREE|nr:uncharacterized protein I206_07764 [Kwoniella pini CBS 10737]OCF46284.1 hypothetical protein I206_07764 [Kwoniella pini CBS 10737]
MSPKLRVLISSNGVGYPPTTPCSVNSPNPTKIETDGFSGNIWIFIKGYNGDLNQGDGKEYFEVKGRESMSYGIVVRGKFKQSFNADQLVFGNVFENSIKDNLPWGTSIATKFMYFIDPTVEADIYADKPWALSPTLATMSHLSLSNNSTNDDQPYIEENSLGWLKDNIEENDIPSYTDDKSQISTRRKWLTKSSNRQLININENTIVGMEFCNGLLDFNTLSATLPSPFSLQIPLLKYWDGQPVTYVCQEKPSKDESPVGGKNKVYWSIAFEIVDEDVKAQLIKKGGQVLSHTDNEESNKSSNGNDKQEDINDDVD